MNRHPKQIGYPMDKRFERSVSGLVIRVERAGISRNGNPTMRVTLSTPTEGYPGEATFLTTSDSMLAYGIDNAEYRDRPHIFGLTRAGRLNGYTEEVA